VGKEHINMLQFALQVLAVLLLLLLLLLLVLPAGCLIRLAC
jgi:hypothetical protein